ncbi:hypothetical protein ACO0K3_03870 [Undibacterium sp. Rencai35W]|uniref:hypothetical protein n=1 Tax=Undibacterium sp. Rencai35W TaxID=3413046 RepID=UPI003BEF52D8
MKNQQTKLIEGLIKLFALKNDAELAMNLKVAPPVISKMRHGKLPIGSSILIKIHDTFDISIKEIRALYLEANF